MAQMDKRHDTTLEQLLPGGDEEQGHWPAPMAPTFGHDYAHEDDHGHDETKKSVLTKVKDKAKKWKHSIFKKKHGHDEDEGNATPPWGVSLEEDNVDLEQDPEYHGAPMYESEMAPGSYKEEPMLRPKPIHRPTSAHKATLKHLDSFKEKDMEDQTTSDKHVLEGNMLPEIDPATKKNNAYNKSLTETVTGILAPVYTMASEATQIITSKIQGQMEPNRDELFCKQMWDKELVSKQVWDKGISVKEYLMQKLEPGEDEKALSEVISEAMSPRKKTPDITGEGGVKGAVSSFLHGSAVPDPTFPEEDPESTTESHPISDSTKCPPIPVSTNPHPVQVPTKWYDSILPVSTNPQQVPVSTESPAILGSTKTESLPLASYPHPIAGLSTTSHTNAVPNTCHADQIEEESGGRILQAN